MGGIARKNKMRALAVGGTADHVHILLSIPSTTPIAKAIQLIKGNSSKWISDTFPGLRNFAWQEGYGAFSISVSGLMKQLHISDRRMSIIADVLFRRSFWHS